MVKIILEILSKISVLLPVFLLFSCGPNSGNKDLKAGIWRGEIQIQGQVLPFNFEVKGVNGQQEIVLMNAEERLPLDSIKIDGDSLFVKMNLFDAELRANISNNNLKGYFVKNYVKDYKLPFNAVFGDKERFKGRAGAKAQLSKKYKIHFSDKPDSVFVIGLFDQANNKVTGSILTTTGDHRFLDGQINNDSLYMSAFDGEHLYLYKAKIHSDSSLTGQYWSGKSFNTSFQGIPNDSFELPNANKITHLKPGYEQFTFSFPGLNGDQVSLNDRKYKGKVVVVQLLGSWCPNCMDESKFLAPWYQKNKSRGVEIIGLAYEKKPEFEYAKKRLLKMKEKLGIDYDLAFAGTSDKENASNSLPMLNAVIAFPTTIFIDKKGKVRKIHTGFSGPGTGVYYEKFIEEFNETVNALLEE